MGLGVALVSFAGSWRPSYWGDEVSTVRATTLPLAALFAFVTTRTDAVHAVYYLAMHAWTALFGISELATRLPSALAAGVAATLIVFIVRRLGLPRLGPWVAIAFAFMPRVTEAGEEARSYAWTIAMVALVWLLLLAAVQRGGRWRWTLLGAAASLSTGLFLLTATVGAAQLVFVLLRHREQAVKVAVAWCAAVVVASPVLIFAWHERGQVSWLAGPGVITPWSAVVEPWSETSWGYGIAAFALLIAGAVRWRAAIARTCPDYLLLAGCWALVPLVLLLGTGATSTPLFTPRYLTFATPGFAMLLVAAVTALGARRIVPVLIALLVVVALPTYIGQRGPFGKNGGSDLRQLAQTVHAHARAGDAIVFAEPLSTTMSARPALWGYPADFAGLLDIELGTPFPASGSFHDTLVPLQTRTAELAKVARVWVVSTGVHHVCAEGPDASVLTRAGFMPGDRYPVHRTVVCEFVRRPGGTNRGTG